MKKIISSLLVFVVVISMVGCSNNSKKLVSDKYYLGSYHQEGRSIGSTVVMEFGKDGTLHIVDVGLGLPGDKRKNYYATYSVEESSLIIKYSDKEYNGVILEEGQNISIGKDTFRQVELSDLEDETVAEFK